MNLQQHLTSVEEFILESEAWKEGSPLLEALRAKIANTQQVRMSLLCGIFSK